MSCGSRIQDYVTKWHAGISQLRAAHYPLIIREVIQAFLVKLPTSIPFQMLRRETMRQIDSIRNDNIMSFVRVTNEALDIDSQYRSTVPTSTVPRQTNHSVTHAPPIQPTTGLTSITPVAATIHTNNRTSLVCSNCHIRGHTVDTCFKTSGGLEGQHDKYQANRTRAQAHLACLDNAMANRQRVEAFLVQMDDVLSGNDVTSMDDTGPDIVVTPDPTPIVAPDVATSFLSTDVEIPPMNEDLFFHIYLSLSHSKSSSTCPLAFSVLSSDLPNLIDPSPIVLSASTFPFNSVLDSGCTHYIIHDRALFWSYDTTLATPVKTANCGFLQTLACGTVRFRVSSSSRTVTFILHDCLHAPDAPINLISVGALTEKGAIFTFSRGQTTISFPSDHPVLPSFSFDATVSNRLSFLNCDFILPPSSFTSSLPDPTSPLLDLDDIALATVFPQVSLTPELWHRHFGHLGIEATRAALTKDYATGITYTGSFAPTHCIPCLVGKTPALPFLNQGHRASAPGGLLHIDTCGPFPVLSPRKDAYFLSILDDYTNFGFVGPLRQKSDAFDFHRRTEASVECTTKSSVSIVRLDGAPELCEGRMGAHLRGRGITMQVTAPYAHQQNGKAERYIRTLEDGMQTLLADAKLPPSFWRDAVCTYQYLRNRLPTSVLPSGTTPFEAYHGHKPDLSHLRVWGCQCFVLIPPELWTKGGPCRYEAIFVGYDDDRIGWYVRDLKGTYHFSHDIIFNESVPGHLSPVCSAAVVSDLLPSP